MAQWIKDPDNRYINGLQVEISLVTLHPETQEPWIAIQLNGRVFPVRGPFASIAAAQTALDNAIVNLGGSI